jgi:hypothetical protein
MTSSICFSDLKYVDTGRDYPLKFVPDFYGPEAGISGNSLEMDHRG